MKPQPRPALKRAEDADLHPALAVAPTQLPTQLGRDTPDTPDVAVDVDVAKKKSKGKRKGKNKAKAKSAGDGSRDRPFLSAGRATSDVLRPHEREGDKPVKLSVKVPKRVRKEIHAIAKHSGTSVDAIVGQALSEWLGDPRRW